MVRMVLYLSIVVTGSVLGANVYNSVVDAPNWGVAIPGSLETAKRYFSVGNPGTFFRVASPMAQVLGLAVVVACWRFGGAVRWLALAALVLAVLGDAMTFAYFYPRNHAMFGGDGNAVTMTRAWVEWSRMNHVRSAIVVAGLMCQLNLLSRIERAIP